MKEHIYDFYGYNEYLFLKINNFCHSLGIEEYLYYISKLFDIEHFALYYFASAIIGFIIIKGIEKKRLFFDFMMRMGTAYASFGFTYAGLKFSVNMPRPYCILNPFKFQTIADVADERCLSGFPSSHTGLAMLITLAVWQYLNPFGRISAIAVIILVALARISLAMHFPADIFYSLMIASIVYSLSYFIYRIFENNIFKWIKNMLLNERN